MTRVETEISYRFIVPCSCGKKHDITEYLMKAAEVLDKEKSAKKSSVSVSQKRKRTSGYKRQKWTRADKIFLVGFRQRGKSWSYIAKKLKRKKVCVSSMYSWLKSTGKINNL